MTRRNTVEDIARMLKEYVEEPGPLDDPCWIWQGRLDKDGYGVIGNWRSNRAAYTVHYGPIPDGKQINHYCHNPACINPLHIYCGTHKQNMDDMRRAGRDGWRPGVSGYQGVKPVRNRWKVTAWVGSKEIYLGYYDTAIEAAKVYNDYIIENNLDRRLNDLSEGKDGNESEPV